METPFIKIRAYATVVVIWWKRWWKNGRTIIKRYFTRAYGHNCFGKFTRSRSLWIWNLQAFLFGALLVPVLVLGGTKSLESALALLTAFALPSIGIIAFLMITESDHRKAWVLKEAEKHNKWTNVFVDSGNAQTYGIVTGAIWILGLGAFVFMLIWGLWIYSWIPLVVTLAISMFALSFYMKKSYRTSRNQLQ